MNQAGGFALLPQTYLFLGRHHAGCRSRSVKASRMVLHPSSSGDLLPAEWGPTVILRGNNPQNRMSAINLSSAVRNSAATLCSDNDSGDKGMGGGYRPDLADSQL